MADISEGVSAKDGGVRFASSRPRLVDLGTGVIPRCRCHCSTTALGVTSSPLAAAIAVITGSRAEAQTRPTPVDNIGHHFMPYCCWHTYVNQRLLGVVRVHFNLVDHRHHTRRGRQSLQVGRGEVGNSDRPADRERLQ